MRLGALPLGSARVTVSRGSLRCARRYPPLHPLSPHFASESGLQAIFVEKTSCEYRKNKNNIGTFTGYRRNICPLFKTSDLTRNGWKCAVRSVGDQLPYHIHCSSLAWPLIYLRIWLRRFLGVRGVRANALQVGVWTYSKNRLKGLPDVDKKI